MHATASRGDLFWRPFSIVLSDIKTTKRTKSAGEKEDRDAQYGHAASIEEDVLPLGLRVGFTQTVCMGVHSAKTKRETARALDELKEESKTSAWLTEGREGQWEACTRLTAQVHRLY